MYRRCWYTCAFLVTDWTLTLWDCQNQLFSLWRTYWLSVWVAMNFCISYRCWDFCIGPVTGSSGCEQQARLSYIHVRQLLFAAIPPACYISVTQPCVTVSEGWWLINNLTMWLRIKFQQYKAMTLAALQATTCNVLVQDVNINRGWC